MKNKLGILPFMFIILMVSCVETSDEFESGLLLGKWRSGTEYWVYNSDNTGYTWDTGDDVTEEEAQRFKWTLVQADLTHIHIFEQGGDGPPKYYTVVELTSTSLRYKDDFGNTFSFSKVQ